MIDGSRTEADAGRFAVATAHEPDNDRPELSDLAVCDECGSDDGQPGYVNFGCVTDDCPGCNRCDYPCLTCNREGLSR